MKTIIKELNLLEISDIEKLVSDSNGRPTKISEIVCTITYWIGMESYQPTQMFLDFGYCDANDFYNAELGGFYLDGKRLSLSDPWHTLDEIFAFDVSEFKSFHIWHDWDRDE